MPHLNVKRNPGRTEEQKQPLAKAVTERVRQVSPPVVTEI